MTSTLALAALAMGPANEAAEQSATAGDYAIAFGKYITIAILIAAAWGTSNFLTKEVDDHHAILNLRNMAFVVIKTGALAGQAYAIQPLVTEKSNSALVDFIWLAVAGTIIVLVFNLVLQPALGKVFMKDTHADALVDASPAIATLIAAFFIADGLIVSGALSGSAPDLLTAVLATIGFSVLGMVVLVIPYLLGGKVFKLRQQAKQGNVAAAILLGSIIVGLGMVLKYAIAGDFTGWVSGALAFIFAAFLGVTAFFSILLILDKVPPHTKFTITSITIEDVVETENNAAAVALGGFMIILAFALSSIAI